MFWTISGSRRWDVLLGNITGSGSLRRSWLPSVAGGLGLQGELENFIEIHSIVGFGKSGVDVVNIRVDRLEVSLDGWVATDFCELELRSEFQIIIHEAGRTLPKVVELLEINTVGVRIDEAVLKRLNKFQIIFQNWGVINDEITKPILGLVSKKGGQIINLVAISGSNVPNDI